MLLVVSIKCSCKIRRCIDDGDNDNFFSHNDNGDDKPVVIVLVTLNFSFYIAI